jgi:hypothetical protein
MCVCVCVCVCIQLSLGVYGQLVVSSTPLGYQNLRMLKCLLENGTAFNRTYSHLPVYVKPSQDDL